MALDGKLLARARRLLDEKREQNSAEHERRVQEVYAALPEVQRIDGELRSLYAQIVRAAMRQCTDPDALLREVDAKAAAARERKTALLRGAGYPEDYLEDLYDCTLCRDRGFLPDGSICTCLRRRYDAEQAKDLSSLMQQGKDDFSAFDLSYYSTQIDPRYGVSPRECMELVLNTCRAYADGFGENSHNLLFQGGTGLGKTFLSACIAKTVAARGFSVCYDTAVAVFEAFEQKKFARDEAAESRTQRFLSCDLMILDDLGTEMTTTFTQTALYTLVNTRLTAGKKTIISTNLTQEELSARYTPQIVSRISGEYDVQTFLGRDIRAIRKERRYQ